MFFTSFFSQKLQGPRWVRCWVLGFALAWVGLCASQAAPLDDSVASGSATEAPIQLKASRQTDAAIQARLEKLFLTMPELENVKVEVNSSVVTLTGDVFSKSAHGNALSFARRVESVVEVQDQIVESRDMRTRLTQAYQQSITRIFNLLDFLPLMLVALLILTLFWWGSHGLANGQ